MARVLVPLAAGCEEIEAVSIVDILRRAGQEVVTASLEEGPVTASRGVVLVADAVLDEVLDEDFDMLVLPGGGPGSDRLDADARIADFVRRQAEAGRWLAAICAAPKVLANQGLLNGKQATAYPGVLEAMDLPDLRLSSQAVVRDGRLITSRGPGTAMDFALDLVEALAGRARRDEVEAGLRPA